MPENLCIWCGQSIAGKRVDARFHSIACKQAYWRWRNRLNFERATIQAGLNNIAQFLDHPETKETALLAFQEVANWLALHDIYATPEQMSLDTDAYTLSNQLGGKDE